MNKIKNSIFFRTISLILILTFISLDISYAYPPEHNAGNSTLVAPSLLQRQPINAIGWFKDDYALRSTVLSIGENLFENGGSRLRIRHLAEVGAIELANKAECIDLDHVFALAVRDNILTKLDKGDVIPDDAIIQIPYSKDVGNGKKETGRIYLALKGNACIGKFAGREWPDISDKYVVKVRPDGLPSPEPAKAEVKKADVTDVTIKEPATEVAEPVKETEVPKDTGTTDKGLGANGSTIIKQVVAIAVMLASLFAMPGMNRTAAIEQTLINEADIATREEILAHIEEFNDGNSIRYERVQALRNIGLVNPDEAVPLLIEALSSENLYRRVGISMVLRDLAAIKPEIVPTLIKALDNGGEHTLRGVAYALGHVRPVTPEIVSALIRLLGDKNNRVVSEAALTLSEIGPAAKEALPELLRLLETNNDYFALGNIKKAIENIEKTPSGSGKPHSFGLFAMGSSGGLALDPGFSMAKDIPYAAEVFIVVAGAVALSIGIVAFLINMRPKYFPSSHNLSVSWHLWRLGSNNPKTSQSAIRALDKIYSLSGMSDPKEIKRLVTALDDYNDNKYYGPIIANALIDIGIPAINFLTKASRSAYPAVSGNAEEMLDIIAESLTEQLHVNSTAPEMLIRIGSRAKKPLADMFDGNKQYATDEALQRRALIFDRIKDRQKLESLITELINTESDILRSIAEALINNDWKPAETVKELIDKGWTPDQIGNVIVHYVAIEKHSALSGKSVNVFESLIKALKTTAAGKARTTNLHSFILPFAIFAAAASLVAMPGIAVADPLSSMAKELVSAPPHLIEVVLPILVIIAVFFAASRIYLLVNHYLEISKGGNGSEIAGEPFRRFEWNAGGKETQDHVRALSSDNHDIRERSARSLEEIADRRLSFMGDYLRAIELGPGYYEVLTNKETVYIAYCLENGINIRAEYTDYEIHEKEGNAIVSSRAKLSIYISEEIFPGHVKLGGAIFGIAAPGSVFPAAQDFAATYSNITDVMVRAGISGVAVALLMIWYLSKRHPGRTRDGGRGTRDMSPLLSIQYFSPSVWWHLWQIKSSNSKIRQFAARNLVKRYSLDEIKDPRDIRRVVITLTAMTFYDHTNDEDARIVMMEKLIESGAYSIDLFVKASHSADPVVSAAAKKILVEMAKRLVGKLQNEEAATGDPIVRDFLATDPLAKMLDGIGQYAADKETAYRALAIKIIDIIKNRRGLESLIMALNNTKSDILRSIAEALVNKNWEPDEVVKELIGKRWTPTQIDEAIKYYVVHRGFNESSDDRALEVLESLIEALETVTAGKAKTVKLRSFILPSAIFGIAMASSDNSSIPSNGPANPGWVVIGLIVLWGWLWLGGFVIDQFIKENASSITAWRTSLRTKWHLWMLEIGNKETRQSAARKLSKIYSLGDTESRRDIKLLITVLGDYNKGSRKSIAATLAHMGTPTIKLFVRASYSADPAVSATAKEILTGMAERSIARPSSKWVARDDLIRIGTYAIKPLEDARDGKGRFETGDIPIDKGLIAEILSEIEDRQGLESLIAALKDTGSDLLRSIAEELINNDWKPAEVAKDLINKGWTPTQIEEAIKDYVVMKDVDKLSEKAFKILNNLVEVSEYVRANGREDVARKDAANKGVVSDPDHGGRASLLGMMPIIGLGSGGFTFDPGLSAVKDFSFTSPEVIDIMTRTGIVVAVLIAGLYILNRYLNRVRNDRAASDSSQPVIKHKRAFAAHPSIAAVPNLIKLFEDVNSAPEARINALIALGKVRPVTPEVVQTLIKASRDEDIGIRRGALDALGEILTFAAPKDIPVIISAVMEALRKEEASTEALRVDDISAQVRAAAVFSRIDPASLKTSPELAKTLTEEVIPKLIEALKIEGLKENYIQVRRVIVSALGRIGFLAPEVVIPELMDALKDIDPYFVGDVIEALGEIGLVAPKIAPAITRMLTHGDSHVRAHAAKVSKKLSVLTPALREKWLLTDLLDRDLSRRRKAEKALNELGVLKNNPEAKVRKCIADLGNRNSDEGRKHAAIALINMQDSRLGPMLEYLKCVRKYDSSYYVPLSRSDVEYIVGRLDSGNDLNLAYRPFISHKEHSESSHGGRETIDVVRSPAQLTIPVDDTLRALPEIPSFSENPDGDREIMPPYVPDVPFWELEIPVYDKNKPGNKRSMADIDVADIEKILDKRSWLWSVANDEKRLTVRKRIEQIQSELLPIVTPLHDTGIISATAPGISIYLTGSFPWAESPNDVNIVVIVKGDREFSRIRRSNLSTKSDGTEPDTEISYEIVGLETLKSAARGENFPGASILRRKLTAYSGAVPLAGIDIFGESTPPPASYRVMWEDLLLGSRAVVGLLKDVKYDTKKLKARMKARRDEAVALEAWIVENGYDENEKFDATKLPLAFPFVVPDPAAWLPLVFSAIGNFVEKYPYAVLAIEAAIGLVIISSIWRIYFTAERYLNGKYETRSDAVEALKKARKLSKKKGFEISARIESVQEPIMKANIVWRHNYLPAYETAYEIIDRFVIIVDEFRELASGGDRIGDKKPAGGSVEGQEVEGVADSNPPAPEEIAKAPEEAPVAPVELAPVNEPELPEPIETFPFLDPGLLSSSPNNDRIKFIEAGNALVYEYSMIPDADDTILAGLNRKMATAEIKYRVERAMAGIEAIEKEAMSPKTRSAIDMLRENMNQFEADGGIASLMVLARRAKRAKEENQKLIIGLETDWIPAVTIKGRLQRNAISALVQEIDAVGKKLKSMGLDNVEIVRGRGAALAGDLLNIKNKTNTNTRNIVVMASVGTINSSSFAWLVNADENDRPFLAGIDPAKLMELYDKYGEDTKNQLHIRLMELFYMTLELAAGKEPSQALGIDYRDYDKKMRRITFLPDADIKNCEILKSTYDREKDALVAA